MPAILLPAWIALLPLFDRMMYVGSEKMPSVMPGVLFFPSGRVSNHRFSTNRRSPRGFFVVKNVHYPGGRVFFAKRL